MCERGCTRVLPVPDSFMFETRECITSGLQRASAGVPARVLCELKATALQGHPGVGGFGWVTS